MPRDVLGEESAAGSIYGSDPAATGLWFDSAAGFGQTGSSGIGDGALFYVPVVIQKAGTIDAVKTEVITAGVGSFVKYGLYADGGGKPFGPLLWQSSAIDTTTTGEKLATVTGVTVPEAPKVWWVATRTWGGTAAVFRTFSGPSPHTFGIGTTANHSVIMYRTDAAGTSTLPDPATSVSQLQLSWGMAAMIRVTP